MAKCGHKTPRYKILADTNGNRYRFFCDLSGAAVCTTGPIRADTEEKELEDAWKENISLTSATDAANGLPTSCIIPIRRNMSRPLNGQKMRR